MLHGCEQTAEAFALSTGMNRVTALQATRHPDRFQAVVMHSGVPPGVAFRRSRLCARCAWPPLLVVHGRLDAVVDASNGCAAAELWAAAGGARATADDGLAQDLPAE